MTAAAELRAKMARLSNFTALLPKLGEIVMDHQKMSIEEGTDVRGVPFPALADATVKARGPGHPYGDKPLLDTTNMYQSIHYEVRTHDSVFAGPSLSQAPYFPYVTQAARKPRQFIGVRKQADGEIRDTVAEHCAQALGL